MVLANEVNPVNQLYRDLSDRYKSGWTFHRFIQGLRKFFGSHDLKDRTAEFQSLYKTLKVVSSRLNDIDIAPVVEQLEDARRATDDLIESLDAEDRRVSPSLVRLFFERVKTRDERILIDLIRFYLEAQRGRSWESERSDKVDYLLTRLGELIASAEKGGDEERLKRILRGISEYAGSLPVDPQKLANRMKLIEAVSGELAKISTFESLTERDLVAHYRNLKHGLGALVFDKSVLPMIVATNLAVSARVEELTEEAQQQIFADYEKVRELQEQGRLAPYLAERVSELQDQVGTFRNRIKRGTLRLDAVAELQGAVREIFGRLEAEETADLEGHVVRTDALSSGEVFASGVERQLLGQLFDELVSALRDARRAGEPPSELDSRLLEYRLSAREIESFARLSSGAETDVHLERFLLAASSLRRKIRLLVEELHNVGVEATPGSREEALAAATTALRVGDGYLRRFSHYLEMHIGEGAGVRELQILKMRLMREYSGLWLLVNDSIGGRGA